MNLEERKAKVDEAKEFWGVVCDPLKPSDVEEGQLFILENVHTKSHRTVIAEKVDLDETGTGHLQFRDARPEEIAGVTITEYLVVG